MRKIKKKKKKQFGKFSCFIFFENEEQNEKHW